MFPNRAIKIERKIEKMWRNTKGEIKKHRSRRKTICLPHYARLIQIYFFESRAWEQLMKEVNENAGKLKSNSNSLLPPALAMTARALRPVPLRR